MQADSEFKNDFHGSSGDAARGSVDFAVTSFDDAVELLEEIGQVSSDLSDALIERAGSLLRQLAGAMEEADWQTDDVENDGDEVTRIVVDGANTLRKALCDDDDAMKRLAELSDDIEARFGDLSADGQGVAGSDWTDDTPAGLDNHNVGDPAQPSAEEIGQLLNELRSDAADDPTPPCDVATDPEPSDLDADQIDSELRDAFLDDASRCLASMEASMLSLESNVSDPEPLQNLGRELHTYILSPGRELVISAVIPLGKNRWYYAGTGRAPGPDPPLYEYLIEFKDDPFKKDRGRAIVHRHFSTGKRSEVRKAPATFTLKRSLVGE